MIPWAPTALPLRCESGRNKGHPTPQPVPEGVGGEHNSKFLRLNSLCSATAGAPGSLSRGDASNTPPPPLASSATKLLAAPQVFPSAGRIRPRFNPGKTTEGRTRSLGARPRESPRAAHAARWGVTGATEPLGRAGRAGPRTPRDGGSGRALSAGRSLQAPPPLADPATLAGLPDTRRPPQQFPRGLPEPSRRAGLKPAAPGRVADGRGDRARRFLPRETGLAGGGCV